MQTLINCPERMHLVVELWIKLIENSLTEIYRIADSFGYAQRIINTLEKGVYFLKMQ